MRKFYALLKVNLAIMTMLILGVSELRAQDRSIQGKVVAQEDGSGLPGVSVVVKGTTNGTVTDAAGSYKLNVADANTTLVFSFVGYINQEVVIGNQTSIDIKLVSDIKALSEVVVTGYTSERKRDIVGAVSQISAKNTVAIPVSNVEQAIQGRIPGVTVFTTGQPGAPSQVRIRGFGSFTSNSPLYIVDGVPTFNVQDINPNDIETTTVLKDADAASIYGSRAASGVIVYTTKHGKNDGKVNVSYDMSYGFTNPGQGIKLLNPEQTANMTFLAQKNNGQNPSHPQYGSGFSPVIPDYIRVGKVGGIFEGDPRIDPSKYNVNFDKGDIYQIVKANKTGTDWYGEITRNAPVQRHSIGLSGGNDRSHYYVGLGYYNQQGILLNQYLKRYTARINSEFKVTKAIRVGENVQVTYRDSPQIGDPQNENAILLAARMNPIIPVYDEFGGYAGTAAQGLNNPSNPVANQDRASANHGFSFGLFGNLYAEADLLKNLTFRTSIGGGLGMGYANGFGFRQYENSENNGAYTVNEGAGYSTNWTWTNTLRYDKKFGLHNVKVLLGEEAIRDPASARNISGSGLNPFTIDPNFRTINNTASTGRQVSSGAATPRTLVSYFGKLSYGFNDKYYVNATLRRDASSVFGANTRVGYFPAFSGAWRISSENFMKAGLPWVEDLKIRGGWGIMGNQAVPAANQYNLYTGTPSTGYDISGSNNSVSPGIIPGGFGNPNGAWEKNITSNIGLDGVFLNGTLDVIVDLWQKKTEDLLYNPEIAATGGVPALGAPFVNVASMTNKGIDLQVIKRAKINDDWNLIIDANFSSYTNKINTIVEGTPYFDAGGTRIGSFVRNQVGHPISAFYGYKQIGYFNSADEAKASGQSGAAIGRFKFEDNNGYDADGKLTGQPDGKIDAADRTFIGTPHPKFTYGLNLTVNYKAFSLELFFYGKQGNDVINFTRWFTDFYPSFSGAAIGARVLNSWTPQNLNPDAPIYENVSNFSTNTEASSYYVEDGSYLRLRNLTLNYNIPASVLGKVGIQRMKVFVQTSNLFTLTKYKGLDPEISGLADTNFGIDIGAYPLTKQYSVGLSLGF